MSTPSQIKENELITQLTWLKNILKEEVVEAALSTGNPGKL
jgi:hypothetical protein